MNRGVKTAKAMWEKLKKSYRRTKKMSQICIKRKLMQLKFDERDTVESFFLKTEKLVQELRTAGGKFNDEDVVNHVMANLPEKFDP